MTSLLFRGPAQRAAVELMTRAVVLILALSAIAAVVDTAELFGEVLAGRLNLSAVILRVLVRIPVLTEALAPLAIGWAAADLWVRWTDDGRATALAASGWTPRDLAAPILAAALVLSTAAGAVRELSAPWSAPILDIEATWVSVYSNAASTDALLVRADHVTATTATSVDLARLRDGRLHGVGHVEAATWTDDGGWHLTGEGGWDWHSGASLPTLPTPDTWRRAAAGGPHAPARVLASQWSSPAPMGWLVQRSLHIPLGGLAGLLGAGLAIGRWPWPRVGAAGLGAVFHLVALGAGASLASGIATPGTVAVVIVTVVCLALAIAVRAWNPSAG